MKKEETNNASHNESQQNQWPINYLKENKVRRVLFVCLGNICRSPAAEGIFRRIVEEAGEENQWEIDSAGIGGWHSGQLPDNRMRIHARRRGLELTHHARQVRASDFDDFDMIIGMDSGNISDLRRLAPTPEAEAKVHAMAEWMGGIATRHDHVPDPYYEGAEGFELVLDLLEDALERFHAWAIA